jgi:hypothetical protein
VADPASQDHAARDPNAWFYRETSLEQLLRDVEPITSIDELAIDDLSQEEAASFLHAIAE